MTATEQRVVMITGAAGALGSAVTRAFADEGARLALVDRREDALEAAFGDLPTALCLAADLTDADSVATAVARCVAQFGRLDVLINIAGGFASGARVHELAVETWDFMFDLNMRSVFLAARAVIPHMLAAGGGRIVTIGAYSALDHRKSAMTPYVVSKSAVYRLTEALAAEYRHDNINVNCILPGTIDTERNRQDMPDADFSRWVRPAQIADVILFLCSPAAAVLHGAALPVIGRS